MNHPPVRFSGIQARAIGRGFAEAIAEASYVVHACCILPDHVHLVVARHARTPEVIVGHLKSAATRQLATEGLHPFGAGQHVPSPRGRRCWKVFLNSPADVRRAIAYAEGNPIKERKPPQRWSFVTPYVD